MSVTSTNRGARTATLALLTCAVVGLSASCDGSPTPAKSTPPSGSQNPAAPIKGIEAPGGGGLKVVESGVSMTTSGLGETMATYGVLLENTSHDKIAYDAQISVTLLDASGQPVNDVIEKSARVTKSLQLITPRQRIGMGRYVYVDRGRAVTNIKIEIGDAWWVPAANAKIAPLTTSGVSATSIKEKHVVKVRFTVDNGYPIAVKRVAMAVFRDSGGAIVGGTGPEEATASHGDFPVGTSPGEIESIGGPPPRADLTRTEVYVYPTTEAVGIK